LPVQLDLTATRLQLGNNLLVDVPDCVASLLELAELSVNSNQLCSLSPAVTERLTSLTHLALSNNWHTSVVEKVWRADQPSVVRTG
jgi:Leucine-rich repeat (LRR) protein